MSFFTVLRKPSSHKSKVPCELTTSLPEKVTLFFIFFLRIPGTLYHHILFPQRLPNAILTHHHHSPRFHTFQRVPLSSRNVNADHFATRSDNEGFNYLTFVVIIVPPHLASQNHNRFRTFAMSVNGHHRARLQCIQHALRLILRRVAQVKIHTQAKNKRKKLHYSLNRLDHFSTSIKLIRGQIHIKQFERPIYGFRNEIIHVNQHIIDTNPHLFI